MKHWIATPWLLFLAALPLTATVAPRAAAQEPATEEATDNQADDKQAKDDKQAESSEALYEVPDGSVEELVAFIKKIQAFQPNNVLEAFSHRKMAGEAIRAAAEKIIEKETDKESEAYKLADQLLLQVEVGSLITASPEEQARVFQKVKKLVDAQGGTELTVGLAYQTAANLERGGNEELAAKAFEEFGVVFAKSENESIADVGEKLQGAARRLRLPGNPIKVEGKDLAGKEFDWQSYRGKVVLVDFWATWCGPCRAELPNIKAAYDQYKDKGFDVVGISLDADRVALEDYVEENKIPWTTLHQNDNSGTHPTADYYGVLGIPTMVLVDREGKVLSTDARGELMKQLLQEQFDEEKETVAETVK